MTNGWNDDVDLCIDEVAFMEFVMHNQLSGYEGSIGKIVMMGAYSGGVFIYYSIPHIYIFGLSTMT